MGNWAIVIGVDRYEASAEWTLRGACRDALGMRDWLLSPAGGDVSRENLALLLSPLPGTAVPPEFKQASNDNIIAEITDVIERSGGRGERFFFYFSGHGLSVSDGLTVSQGILASDFAPKAAHHSLTVKSLFELFQGTHFGEQYFFIDACRNIPFSGIRLLDFPHIDPPVVPTPPQFVMYATQPLVTAAEVGFPGDESGAFTSALLAALGGKGAAKAWDDASGEYLVCWNDLFSSVVEQVKARALEAAPTVGRPIIQEPRQYGEKGSENPILGRFPEGSVPEEDLLIELAPAKVLQHASVSINALSGVAREIQPPITSLPVVARLRPRWYGIHGSATGFKASRKFVKFYAPATVSLEFQEDPTPPPPPPGPISSDAVRARYRSSTPPAPSPGPRSPIAEPKPLAVPMRAQARGELEVKVSDPLAFIEVADESGKLIANDRGSVTRSNLAPGFYSVRMLSPEGGVVAESVESPEPGGTKRVSLSVSPVNSPAMTELVACVGLKTNPDGSQSVSRAMDPSFFFKTSTILALAAASQLETDRTYGDRLRKVPLAAIHEVTRGESGSGLFFVLGDERNEGYWESATLTLVREGQEQGLDAGGAFSRLMRSFGISAQPGHGLLRLAWAESEALIPCHTLPDRVTLFVVTREMDGSLEVHQYMPLTTPPDWKAHQGDPTKGKRYDDRSSFAAIPRTEYMQRTFAHGRLSPLRPDVQTLLWDKWRDPIAGCLGAYLELRMSGATGLDYPTENLVRYFGELPDSHILRGAILLAQGKDAEAMAEFDLGMNKGLPIFREGVNLLADKLRQLPFSRETKEYWAKVSRSQMTGQPWCMQLKDTAAREPEPEPTEAIYEPREIWAGVEDESEPEAEGSASA